MKDWLIGAALLLAMTASASAEDLSHAPASTFGTAPVLVPVQGWTGFYIGGNAGYAWGNSDPSTTTEFTAADYWNILSVPQVNAAGAGRVKPDGFAGGVQAGYNWQTGGLVLGTEVDFGSFHLNASRTAGAVYLCCAPASFAMTQTVNADWLFTARARVGWADKNWLFYGTGGLAVTDLSHRSSFADSFGAAENVNDSTTKTGWAAGGGIEYALLQHWTVRGEFLYVSFGSVSSTSILGPAAIVGCACTPMFHSANLNADIVRLGVNYKY
jgi:outer membrane immunogenic protein